MQPDETDRPGQKTTATEAQQHTGNHKPAGAPDAHGADRFGGTRTGADNVEKPGK